MFVALALRNILAYLTRHWNWDWALRPGHFEALLPGYSVAPVVEYGLVALLDI